MAGNKNSGNRGTPKNKTPIIKEKEILSHLKEGKGIRETAALSKVSKTTVERIRYENVEDLPKWRKKTAENMMRVQTKLLDKLEDSVDELEPSAKSLASLSISIGIISDKLKDNLQTGQQTIEHKHLHINHSDINVLLADNKTANKQLNTNKKDSLLDKVDIDNIKNPMTSNIFVDLKSNDKEGGEGVGVKKPR